MTPEKARAKIELVWGGAPCGQHACSVMDAMLVSKDKAPAGVGRIAEMTGLSLEETVTALTVLVAIGAFDPSYIWAEAEDRLPLPRGAFSGLDQLLVAHPATGEMFADWQAHVVPLYAPASEMRAECVPGRPAS